MNRIERHPLDVVDRQFARAFGFERFGIFIGAGQQQFVANADLFEQLSSPRTLRCEVDERGLGDDGPPGRRMTGRRRPRTP